MGGTDDVIATGFTPALYNKTQHGKQNYHGICAEPCCFCLCVLCTDDMETFAAQKQKNKNCLLQGGQTNGTLLTTRTASESP